MVPEGDSIESTAVVAGPLSDRMRAKAWIAVWVMVGSFLGLAPPTIYLGRPEWLAWCLLGALAVTVFQVFRLPPAVGVKRRLIEELVAGVASLFPLTVLGLLWLLFYGLFYWVIFAAMHFAPHAKPWTEEANVRYASFTSLLAPILFGAGFISLAVTALVSRIYGRPDQEAKSLSFRQAMHRRKLTVGVAVVVLIAGVAALSYFALFTHSFWSLAALQVGIIAVSSILWDLGDGEPLRVPREDALKVVQKLLQAQEPPDSRIIPLADSPDPDALGVDLIRIAGHAATAVAVIALEARRTPPDTPALVKSALRLRDNSWWYLRRLYPREVSSLDVMLVLAGFEPPPEFVQFAEEEFVRYITLLPPAVARILKENETETLQSAKKLLARDPGKPAWH